MDDGLLAIILTALVATTALNLFLILRIARIVVPRPDAEPLVPLVGGATPKFIAQRKTGGPPVSSDDLAGKPIVLVFLASGCSTCRSTIPELVSIFPGTQEAGVEFWIIGADDVEGVGALVEGTPLASRALTMEPSVRKTLNPLSAAPLYIFIDETMVIQAGDYLGDETWRLFVDQMREVGAANPDRHSLSPAAAS